jgi:hypothetical protein
MQKEAAVSYFTAVSYMEHENIKQDHQTDIQIYCLRDTNRCAFGVRDTDVHYLYEFVSRLGES